MKQQDASRIVAHVLRSPLRLTSLHARLVLPTLVLAVGPSAGCGSSSASGADNPDAARADGATTRTEDAATKGRDGGGKGHGDTGPTGRTEAGADAASDSSRDGSTGRDAAGLCTPPSSVTADFFVSPQGSDTWSGAAATSDGQGNGPFLTLTRAQMAVQAARQATPTSPITVDLRQGTYELAATWSLTSADSGSSSALVTYQAYPCETPIISGGLQIAPSSWKLVAGSSPPTYQTTIPANAAFTSQFTPFEQLWVNGTRVFRPRAGGWNYLTIAETPAPGQTAQDSSFLPSTTTLLASGLTDSDIEVVVFEQWTVSRQRLVSVLANGGITTTAFGDQSAYHGYLKGHRVYIDNVQSALGTAGQWYLDKSTMVLTYVAASGEDPTATTPVVYPLLTTLVSADKLSYVTFSGITFAYSNWTVPSGGYSAGQGLWALPAALELKDTLHVSISGCTVAHTGATGITYDATGATAWSPTATDPFSNELTGNTLSDLGANGVRVGTTPVSGGTAAKVAHGIHIAGNLLTGGSRFLHSGMGVLVGEAHDNTIEHNEITDFYQTGVAVGFSFAQKSAAGVVTYPPGLATHNTVSQNLIHDIGEGVTNDMGGVYFLTSDEGAGTGPVIEGNVIHDIVNNPDASYQGANGIYFDQGTSNATATNNLVYRVTGAGFAENYGRNNVVQNNVFAYPRNAMFNHALSEATGLWATFSHDIFLYDENFTGFDLFAGNDWVCPSTGCPSWVDFASNLYWNATNPMVSGVDFKLSSPAGAGTFAWWQTLDEDVGSTVANPEFTSLTGTSYVLGATSPALAAGLFAPFDTSGAGPTAAVPPSGVVPAAAPLQVPSTPSTFF